MKVRSKYSIRARLVTFLLIGLVAHAALACVAHHHERGLSRAGDTALKIGSDCGHHSQHVPVSSGDSECLTCRAQRTFVDGPRSLPTAPELQSGPVSYVSLLSDLHSHITLLVLSDRAPPLA